METGGNPARAEGLDAVGPDLEVDTPSPRAREAAADLAAALVRRDRALRALTDGRTAEAMFLRATARESMGRVFRAEFPHLGDDRADRAGRRFATAQFMRGEIDRWSAVVAGEADLERLCLDVTGTPLRRGPDAYWTAVHETLVDVCRDAGLDEAYAAHRTAHWRASTDGASAVDGETDARTELVRAQAVKLAAMTGGAGDENRRRTLADCYATALSVRDRWRRRRRADDHDRFVGLVGQYYDRVFALRDGGRTG